MTQKFRTRTPKRKKVKKKNSYTQYRKDLILDFFDRCGYCDTPRIETMENFHIDHFAPREKFKSSKWKHLLDEYNNLVYSCPHCNILKSDTWVTNDFKKSTSNGKGFLCPCKPAYDKAFERDKSGNIIPKNKIAIYIYDELKFYLARFALIWKMEKLYTHIQQIKKIQDKKLKKLAGELALEYIQLLDEFKEAKGFKRL